MLEDTKLEDNPITEETFSLDNIFRIFGTFTFGSSSSDSDVDGGYFSNRPKDSRARIEVSSTLFIAAKLTRDSYIATFSDKMSEYRNIAIRRITSCNSFEVADLVKSDKPVALFLCFRDELKTHFHFMSLFVQEAYKTFIDIAGESDDNKLDVPFYFILDEFGNFPKLTNFDNVISASAGRNVWFILVLQSYAQLYAIYGEATAKIILDNLNVKLFFGSNNMDTIKAFSTACGVTTRVSPQSAFAGDGEEINGFSIETISLVPNSMLCKLQPGECIVTEANSPVLFSRLERYYLCPEYNELPLARVKDYKCSVNPMDPIYSYKYKSEYKYEEVKKKPFSFFD